MRHTQKSRQESREPLPPIQDIGAEIRAIVFRYMGLGEGTLKAASDQGVHSILAPHERDEYPLSNAGDVSRVTTEWVKMWPHYARAMKAVLQDDRLRRLIEDDPHRMLVLQRAFHDAMNARGRKANAEEWKILHDADIKDIVKDDPNPDTANRMNAEFIVADVRQRIARLKAGELVTILDLGTGGGGTIVPIVKQLTPDERNKVNVVLVDVMRLDGAVDSLGALGLSDGQITAVDSNLADLSGNAALRDLAGRVDVVTSGAALHHTPDIRPVFEAVHSLLRKGGLLSFWDLGSVAWRAPTLIPAPEGSVVVSHGEIYDKDRRTRVAPSGSAFFSLDKTAKAWGIPRSPPREADALKAMFASWLDLLHCPKEEKETLIAKYFDPKRLKRGEPISFEGILKDMLNHEAEPGRQAKTQFWTGTRTPEIYNRAINDIFHNRPFTIYPTDSSLIYLVRATKQE